LAGKRLRLEKGQPILHLSALLAVSCVKKMAAHPPTLTAFLHEYVILWQRRQTVTGARLNG
jgi:hypothetical protein